jgi:hypothetical protein
MQIIFRTKNIDYYIIKQIKMGIRPSKNNNRKDLNFKITEKGSLGLLAYGDIGLREWRKVKKEFYKKDSE